MVSSWRTNSQNRFRAFAGTLNKEVWCKVHTSVPIPMFRYVKVDLKPCEHSDGPVEIKLILASGEIPQPSDKPGSRVQRCELWMNGRHGGLDIPDKWSQSSALPRGTRQGNLGTREIGVDI